VTVPEFVLTQFVSPDDEHIVLETCRVKNKNKNKNKNKYIEKNCASRWSFTQNHYMMHGQQNIKSRTLKLVGREKTFGGKEVLSKVS
jgi:hypothetical protein